MPWVTGPPNRSRRLAVRSAAARLEGEVEEFGSELLLSQQVLDATGVDLSGTEEHDITVRGQEKAIHVHVVKVARDLKPKKRMPMTEEAEIKSNRCPSFCSSLNNGHPSH